MRARRVGDVRRARGRAFRAIRGTARGGAGAPAVEREGRGYGHGHSVPRRVRVCVWPFALVHILRLCTIAIAVIRPPLAADTPRGLVDALDGPAILHAWSEAAVQHRERARADVRWGDVRAWKGRGS